MGLINQIERLVETGGFTIAQSGIAGGRVFGD
jgi:hypothetical protein